MSQLDRIEQKLDELLALARGDGDQTAMALLRQDVRLRGVEAIKERTRLLATERRKKQNKGD